MYITPNTFNESNKTSKGFILQINYTKTELTVYNNRYKLEYFKPKKTLNNTEHSKFN